MHKAIRCHKESIQCLMNIILNFEGGSELFHGLNEWPFDYMGVQKDMYSPMHSLLVLRSVSGPQHLARLRSS